MFRPLHISLRGLCLPSATLVKATNPERNISAELVSLCPLACISKGVARSVVTKRQKIPPHLQKFPRRYAKKRSSMVVLDGMGKGFKPL